MALRSPGAADGFTHLWLVWLKADRMDQRERTAARWASRSWARELSCTFYDLEDVLAERLRSLQVRLALEPIDVSL